MGPRSPGELEKCIKGNLFLIPHFIWGKNNIDSWLYRIFICKNVLITDFSSFKVLMVSGQNIYLYLGHFLELGLGFDV